MPAVEPPSAALPRWRGSAEARTYVGGDQVLSDVHFPAARGSARTRIAPMPCLCIGRWPPWNEQVPWGCENDDREVAHAVSCARNLDIDLLELWMHLCTCGLVELGCCMVTQMCPAQAS